MREFLHKFFGAFPDEHGWLMPYSDHLGGGVFNDWRYFTFLGVFIVSSIVLFHVFQKHPKAGRRTIYIIAIALLSVRTVNQTVRALTKIEVPWTRALPFHLCTISTFIVPLAFLCKWNKLKNSVYVLGIIGAIMTFIFGDQFDSKFMTFGALEGITAHMILMYIPIFSIAIGDWQLRIRDVWQTCGMMLIYVGWATLANKVFFHGDTNYMYLEQNKLPNNFGGDYFFFVYVAIFIVMLAGIYGLPMLYGKIKRSIRKSHAKEAQT